MKKKIIYIDMDGVIADFDKAKEELYPGERRPELKMDFSKQIENLSASSE